VVQRPLITIGVVAVLILLVLTLTSTNGWQKRLGRGWSRLHQTVYLAAVLSILHFYLIRIGKNDVVEVYVYGLVLAGLLALRRWPALNKTAH
jgi:sulfoxide reductase heme-binding subunit YedZ